ncbi:DUF7288 family protein [Salinirussus salinus]|uniref:DUF7288 family protein n=1 Tax=Salinirussus salinus TaxID=1198300 RepID=UPI00135C3EF9|nr:hypothetical protein [Salinirussus salinus]
MRRLPPRESAGGGDRGQAHTLEAVIGALLLLTSVLFALQSTAVTPLSASTSSQHIENQQQERAQGLLAAAAENGTLKPAVLYWNPDVGENGRFHGTDGDNRYYEGTRPNVTFAQMLNRTFTSQGIAYNVNFEYRTQSGTDTQRFIYNGVPSDNAVSASWTTVLDDSDHLYTAQGKPDSNARIGDDNTDFYIPDTYDSDLYNVVRVEVVVWRV